MGKQATPEKDRGPLRDGPLFPYFGAKWQSTIHYPPPRYPIVIEPFAGSACYSTRLRVRHAVLCDVADPVAGAWRFLLRATQHPTCGPVRSLPSDVSGIDDIRKIPGVSSDAADLIGWWISGALPKIRYNVGAWVKRQMDGIMWDPARKSAPSGGGGVPVWGERAKGRLIRMLPIIRNWKIHHADYRTLPNVEATWFVDPPYQVQGKGYHGSSNDIDFDELATWCKSRKGQVIVCEQEGATWLPFRAFRDLRASRGRKSAEVIWTKDPVLDRNAMAAIEHNLTLPRP